MPIPTDLIAVTSTRTIIAFGHDMADKRGVGVRKMDGAATIWIGGADVNIVTSWPLTDDFPEYFFDLGPSDDLYAICTATSFLHFIGLRI